VRLESRIGPVGTVVPLRLADVEEAVFHRHVDVAADRVPQGRDQFRSRGGETLGGNSAVQTKLYGSTSTATRTPCGKLNAPSQSRITCCTSALRRALRSRR